MRQKHEGETRTAKRWRVWFSQVNQTYMDVEAANDDEAREKAVVAPDRFRPDWDSAKR